MKPILFNTEMVRAILDGRKTETRRIPSKKIRDKWFDYDEWVMVVATPESTSMTEKEFYEQYLPYHTDDILYVREMWSELKHAGGIHKRYVYKVSDIYPFGEKYICKFRWKPSANMPKEAARIFLRVTNVRVERLQEMPHDAPKKEGIHYCECQDRFTWNPHTTMQDCYINPMGAMRALWNSTVKKSDLETYGWNANPWVYVISFERITKEEAMKGETE